MKTRAQFFTLIALVLASSAASAQFVKGNEAVRCCRMDKPPSKPHRYPLPDRRASRNHAPPTLAAIQNPGKWWRQPLVYANAQSPLLAQQAAGHPLMERKNFPVCGSLRKTLPGSGASTRA